MLRRLITSAATCYNNNNYNHLDITYNIQKRCYHRVIDHYCIFPSSNKCQQNAEISLIGLPYWGNIVSLQIKETISDNRFNTFGPAIASSSYATEFIEKNKHDEHLIITNDRARGRVSSSIDLTNRYN